MQLFLHLIEKVGLKEPISPEQTVYGSCSDNSSLKSMDIVIEIIPPEEAELLENRVDSFENLVNFPKRMIFEALINIEEEVPTKTIKFLRILLNDLFQSRSQQIFPFFASVKQVDHENSAIVRLNLIKMFNQRNCR